MTPPLTAAIRRYPALILAILLIASAIALLAAAPARAGAVQITVDGITYSVDLEKIEAGATVTLCDPGIGPDVTIPDAFQVAPDYAIDFFIPVTAIGDSACRAKNLTSVTLPDTITAIGNYAFAGNQLTSITLPDTLTTISDWAFSDNQLTAVTLPDTLTTIGNGSFAVNRLSSLPLPDSVTAIGEHAFYRNQLTTVTLPDTITTTEYMAFAENQLASITLPDTLTTIGDSSFSSNQLTSVTLPENLTTIDPAAFNRNQLTSITLPENLTTIGNNAFSINQLTSITLPETLTTIDYNAFFRNQLTSITLPGNVDAIGHSAFGGNPHLTQVRFTGPAPISIAGPSSFAASLGTAEGLAVAFHARYLGQTPQTGYTTPEWLGYTSMPAHTVSFDTGEGSAVQPVTIWPGETLELPQTPTRQGYDFTGWYATPDLATDFDAQLPLTSDITIYAGWQPTSVPATPLTPGGSSLAEGSLGSLIPAGSGS